MRIKSLQMRARVAVEGFFKGIHRSPYHGFSVEFSEYREYSPGDDPRYLDWRLFARSDRYYVKRFEDETNLRCYLVLDTSRSMGYRLGRVHQERLRAHRGGHDRLLPVHASATRSACSRSRTGSPTTCPPRHRPGHLRRLMAMLEREPAGRATDLAGPLEQIAATVRKRGLIILISDLLAPTDSLRTRLGYLRSRGHDVVVLRVLDPAEVEFTFATPAMFLDVESGRELYIDPDAARAEYLRRFAAHAAEIERACVDLGIEYEPITTDRPLELVLFDLLKARMRRGRRPGRRARRGTGRRAMSFLTPLYVLGLLAVAAPIVFHLIRRTPRGEVPFSSLMFLSPSPPRLTRRSRLDHWLLLLLRAAALCLLAFAFARPFLRQAGLARPRRRRAAGGSPCSSTPAPACAAATSGRRRKAMAAGGRSPRAGRPTSSPCSRSTRRPGRCSASRNRRRSTRRGGRPWPGRLDRLAPTWGATDLGQALVDAVAAIEDVAERGEKDGRMPRRIVLISDLQQGSRLEALGDFEWPSDVELDLKTVDQRAPTPACTRWPKGDERRSQARPDHAGGRPGLERRGLTRESRSSWSGSTSQGGEAGKPIAVYVPPGESRVVRVPRPHGSVGTSRPAARGGCPRVRQHAVPRGRAAGRRRRSSTSGPTRPTIPRACSTTWSGSSRRRPRPERHASDPVAPTSEPGVRTGRLRAAGRPGGRDHGRERRDGCGSSCGDGGTVLARAHRAADGPATLAALAGAPRPARVRGGRRRSRRDARRRSPSTTRSSPRSPAPQFNDFTKIHFWKYRRIDAGARSARRASWPGSRTATPRSSRRALGKGRLVVLASGWDPADSQLARSSKFVPLMSALLEGREPAADSTRRTSWSHDRVPLPSASATPAGAWSSPSRTATASSSSRRARRSTRRTSPASTRSRPPADAACRSP